MNRELVQWQLIDPSNGCVFPWLTHPFLEVLKTWDLKDKVVLEYGMGRSTVWWADKAKHVVAVETNSDWYNQVHLELREKRLTYKVDSCLVPDITDGESDPQQQAVYVNAPWDDVGVGNWLVNNPFDIIVVDGILRHECIREGIKILGASGGGKLIVDNWQQDGFVCPACADLLRPYEGHVYRQEDHTDHHGNPWQTAYWEIPALC